MFSGYKYSNHIWFLASDGKMEIDDGNEEKRSLFSHTRYSYKVKTYLYSEVFSQAENDRFRRLKARYLSGVGLRIKILNCLFLGNSYMYEYNKTQESEDFFHRISSYISWIFNLSKNIMYSSVIYFQPEIKNINNNRLLSVSDLEFTINNNLQSGVNFVFHRETDVPSGIQKNDWSFVNYLSVSF